MVACSALDAEAVGSTPTPGSEQSQGRCLWVIIAGDRGNPNSHRRFLSCERSTTIESLRWTLRFVRVPFGVTTYAVEGARSDAVHALMAKLGDALRSNRSVERRAGSNPAERTTRQSRVRRVHDACTISPTVVRASFVGEGSVTVHFRSLITYLQARMQNVYAGRRENVINTSPSFGDNVGSTPTPRASLVVCWQGANEQARHVRTTTRRDVGSCGRTVMRSPAKRVYRGSNPRATSKRGDSGTYTSGFHTRSARQREYTRSRFVSPRRDGAVVSATPS